MVIGLGTAEVVALHHSGVPRKNRHGQWLRKDGSVAQPGDSDEMIDWIGNEGIRISSILKTLSRTICACKYAESKGATIRRASDRKNKVTFNQFPKELTKYKVCHLHPQVISLPMRRSGVLK